MATQVQWRGGSEAEHAAFTGAAKEVTVDTTLKTLRVHDGTTPGGFKLARKDELDASFDAIKTSYYGDVDPSADPVNGVIAGSTWADTFTGTFKRRNATNTAWLIENKLFEDMRLTTTNSDTTANLVLKTGDWGIGGGLPVLDSIDLLADDNLYEFYVTSAVNYPAAASASTGYVKKEARNSNYRKVTFTPYNGLGPWINICNNGVWGGWVEVYHTGNISDFQWLGTPVGSYITPYVAPPTDDPRFRYILCTAGESGTGGYNEGILISESVSGTAPKVLATAVISLAGSPMDGVTVRLVNTEERFIRPGPEGRVQEGQNEQHQHQQYNPAGTAGTLDAFTPSSTANGSSKRSMGFTDYSGGDENRPRNVGATFYRRIL